MSVIGLGHQCPSVSVMSGIADHRLIGSLLRSPWRIKRSSVMAVVSLPREQSLPVDDNWVKSEQISNCIEEQPKDSYYQVLQGYDKENKVDNDLVYRIDNLKGHRKERFVGSALVQT